ncbi:MAG: hypothetical protein HRT61_19340 [Ekhidna sp.]|nr:hypothetical protein [Ekhidna sp.]
MKSNCITGKICYLDEDLALEALIQFYIRNSTQIASGPVNVYHCPECNEWHFTSKDAPNPNLIDKETTRRILEERRAYSWEQKFKKY